MAEFVAFVVLVVVTALAGIGAARVWEWWAESSERVELARRERQAELEIQQIAHQAQLAILSEAMRRAQRFRSPWRASDVIGGEVANAADNTGPGQS